VYRSKPFIVARVLCCLFVDLIWRNLLYIACGKGELNQSLPRWEMNRVSSTVRQVSEFLYLSEMFEQSGTFLG